MKPGTRRTLWHRTTGMLVPAWWYLVLGGGILVGATALGHAALLIGQVRGALPARFGALVRYYVAAAACLVVGVALGIVMAHPAAALVGAGEYYPRLYIAHIGLNMLGWVGLTVIGTVALLWPTVVRSRVVQATRAGARSTLPDLFGGLVVLGLGCL